MIWLLSARVASAEVPADLLREMQIPGGVQVAAEIVDGQWRFVITGQRSRTFSAPPPASESEREALVALLESLLADLSLPEAPEAPAPPPPPPRPVLLPQAAASLSRAALPPGSPPPPPPAPAQRPASPSAPEPPREQAPSPKPAAIPDAAPAPAQPAPPPALGPAARAPRAPAEAAPEPPARATPAPALPPAAPEPPRALWAPLPLRPWLAVEGLLRLDAAPGAGVALGGSLVLPPLSISLGAALRPARAIRIAPDASFQEVALDLEGSAGRRVALRAGAGITARDYRQYGDLVLRSWTGRLVVGAEARIDAERWTVAPMLLLDTDLARISFDERATWLPLTLRSQIRIEFHGRPRTEISDADIGRAAGRRDEEPPRP